MEIDIRTITIFFKTISRKNLITGKSNNFQTRYKRNDKAIIEITILTYSVTSGENPCFNKIYEMGKIRVNSDPTTA